MRDDELEAAWDRIKELEDTLERIEEKCRDDWGTIIPGFEEIAEECVEAFEVWTRAA